VVVVLDFLARVTPMVISYEQIVRATFIVALALTTTRRCVGSLFESSAIGSTGVTYDALLNQSVPGLNIGSGLFQGVRLYLPQEAAITSVGGHFLATNTDQSIFAAMVKLADGADFPNSGDLSTSDVQGTTLLTLPSTSADVKGALPLKLSAGWYALVFGSGIFGADGSGFAVLNGTEIGVQQFLVQDPNFGGTGWAEQHSNFRNARYVVEGEFVPEPGAAELVAIGVLAATRLWRLIQRQSLLQRAG
jgi:hypothetical protein